MGLRGFCAFLCLFSLTTELSLDNTHAFVRIAPAAASELSSSEMNGAEDCIEENARASSDCSSNDPDSDRSFEESLGHDAGPVFSFIYVVPKKVHRHFCPEVWNYRDVDRYQLLRPPIFS